MNDLLSMGDQRDRLPIEQASTFLQKEFPTGLSRTDLRQVNQDKGIDFATALLYAHFRLKLPPNWLDGNPSGTNVDHSTPPSIAIVPGAFHKEYAQLGADGREIARLAAEKNWRCQQIPTASLGRLDENAETIIRWFDSQEITEFVVVSLSKGSADLKIALEKRPDLWRRIHSWISVSGILHGTAIADWLMSRKRLWFAKQFVLWHRNLELESLTELRNSNDSRLKAAINESPTGETPPRQKLVHLLGFPLKRHLSSWRARLWHRRFRGDGPNDSVIMLEDLLETPGIVVPVWGADHYMQPSNLPPRLVASIVSKLSKANPAGQGAAELVKATTR